MIQQHCFTDNIVLTPSQLSNIDQNLCSILKQKINSCSKEYGYIQSISKVQTKGNVISRTSGSCVFQVSYVASCLKPVEGETIPCTVLISFPEGMLVSHEKMRVIVPHVHRPVGTRVDVTLINIRYESSEYQCVGKIAGDIA